MMSGLFDFLRRRRRSLLIAGTLGVRGGTAPDGSRRRAATMDTAVSPLWLLTPILLGFILVWWGNDAGILLSAFGVKIPALLILQLVVASWVIYRNRHWPFLVVPLAVLCCLWQWGIMMGVVLEGVKALGS
jgi:hypothetical protein